MTETMDEFVADMRRLVTRWRDDITTLEAAGEADLVDQIKAWIDEAERIIEAHCSHGASSQAGRFPRGY